jgi:hypothetical protein
MELSHSVGEVEDYLRHERTGLQIAPSLELEQVPLGPDYHPNLESLTNPSHGTDPNRPPGSVSPNRERGLAGVIAVVRAIAFRPSEKAALGSPS